jgi:ABC-type uncharacterized transport system permease subunit
MVPLGTLHLADTVRDERLAISRCRGKSKTHEETCIEYFPCWCRQQKDICMAPILGWPSMRSHGLTVRPQQRIVPNHAGHKPAPDCTRIEERSGETVRPVYLSVKRGQFPPSLSGLKVAETARLLTMTLLLIRSATVLYGLASISALPAVLWSRERFRSACIGLATLAAALQCIDFGLIYRHTHRFVPTGVHEVQSALGLLMALAFLAIVFRYCTASFGLFALPMAFLLALPSALGPDRYSFSSSTIRGGWIAIHVAALLAADTALVFSLLASLLYVLQERRLKAKHNRGFFAWLPPLDTMDRIAQSTLVLGFLCMTLGLFAGSLIAQERVGATYFRDPKVLLSFAMWLIYISILLVRQSKGLRGRQAVYVSSIAFLVVLSVWAANLLSTVHRFAAP